MSRHLKKTNAYKAATKQELTYKGRSSGWDRLRYKVKRELLWWKVEVR